MTGLTSSSDAQHSWRQLRPNAEFAVQALRDQLGGDFEDPQELFNGYIFMRRILADFMQALIQSQTTVEEIGKFKELHNSVRDMVSEEYASVIPDKYLRIPYGSRIHAELFAMLFRRQGEPVEADLLRIITADSVHTERRTRELRELGFDISASKSGPVNTYTLDSLAIDPSKLAAIVANQIRMDKTISVEEKGNLLSRL